MSYSTIIEMAHSESLIGRAIVAVVAEHIDNPESWARNYIWRIVSAPGWDAQWESARVGYNVNQNPDFGARTDVITDGDILASVKAVQTGQNATLSAQA